MNDIEKAIAEITDHAERNLEVKLSAETAAIVVQALEKQIPQTAIQDIPSKIRYVSTYTCSNCKGSFSGQISNYCYHCGQKLDWSEEENEID